jgi:hypothetical protein
MCLNIVVSKSAQVCIDRSCGLQEIEAPVIEAPVIEAPGISTQLAHEGDKVICPRHRPTSTPRKSPWYTFLSEAELTQES